MSQVTIENSQGRVQNDYPAAGLKISVDGVQCYPAAGAAAPVASAPVTVELVAAMIVHAPIARVAVQSPTTPTYTLDQVPSTLDPTSMTTLLYVLGGTSADVAAYRKWYYTKYPAGQVPGGIPHNPENLSPAQIAAIVNG